MHTIQPTIPLFRHKLPIFSISESQLFSFSHLLLPLNRDYNPIIVTPHEAPEMVVVGEWVSSID